MRDPPNDPNKKTGPLRRSDSLNRDRGPPSQNAAPEPELSSFKAILLDLDRHLQKQSGRASAETVEFTLEAEPVIQPPIPPTRGASSLQIAIVLLFSFAIGVAVCVFVMAPDAFQSSKRRVDARLVGSHGDYTPAVAAWSATSNPIWPARETPRPLAPPPQPEETGPSAAELLRQALSKPARPAENEIGSNRLLEKLLEWKNRSPDPQ